MMNGQWKRLVRGMVSVLLLANVVMAERDAGPAWISCVSEEQLVTEGAIVKPLNRPDALLSFEKNKDKNQFPTVQIHAPEGSWDLSAFERIRTSFKNTGDKAFTVEFWAVGAPGWDAPVKSISINPGEERECIIDLQQRWKGGLANKVDAGRIEYLRVSLKKPPKGCRFEMGPIFLCGTATAQKEPDGYERLNLPAMVEAAPGPGRRVKHQLPSYEKTELYHSLYLPTDWKPGKRYPIIVEYAGNRWLSAPCHSIGRPEGSRMGYGMSAGKGYIWVNAPFVSKNRKTQALNGWGDPEATIDYAIKLVNHLCEKFGGDHSAVILTGFSRGAVAVGYIGRYNDRISDVWLAFHAAQHHDGDGIHGATYEGALHDRGPRIKGRFTFHTDNEKHKKLLTLFEELGEPVTYASSGIGAHTDTCFLENRPSTLALRKWLADVVATKPGTHAIAGRVTDARGKGQAHVRVQSGATHITYTDADGRYQLDGLIAGLRTVSASDGSSSQVREVELKDGDINNFDIVLSP